MKNPKKGSVTLPLKFQSSEELTADLLTKIVHVVPAYMLFGLELGEH